MTLSIDTKATTSTVSDKQEPVAWVHRFIEGGFSLGKKPADLDRHPDRWQPLYAAPVHSWESIRETVELRGSHSEEYEEGFWAGLRAYEDKLREQDWYGQHQWQCGYERGWDAAMEKKENSLPLMQEGKDFTISKPWVGLTDEEIEQLWNSWLDGDDNTDWGFERSIEAKLKEKNT
jgi:hypothetical protein